MRSKLFVPGSRPDLFAKALASEADAVSIDLEDAVVEDRKAEARNLVAQLLESVAGHGNGKAIVVRVNASNTPHFEADVQAVARSAIGLLNLPKVESVEQVDAAVAVLERMRKEHGAARTVEILANIETAKGLQSAASIAAHPRVAGLQLGYLDLFESLGIERRDAANVHAVMFAVRMAAGQAGKFAYDGAFADVRDLDGFRAEAHMAKKLGYLGKSCIHPSQVALANDVFHPSEADFAHAQRVIEAARRGTAQGRGAFLLDGRMIDAPMVRRAEAIVATRRAVKA